ncbi:rCG64448, partial [Rattus norvegicus]
GLRKQQTYFWEGNPSGSDT